MPADTVLGNVEAGLASAAIRLGQTYTTPMCHHNPMEPHTAVATWPTTC
jgi:xanthine dehydrogenase YagR molybdenum-binding subunit